MCLDLEVSVLGVINIVFIKQDCKLKFRLRELTSFSSSAAASAVCFEDGDPAWLVLREQKQEMSSLNLHFRLQACY